MSWKAQIRQSFLFFESLVLYLLLFYYALKLVRQFKESSAQVNPPTFFYNNFKLPFLFSVELWLPKHMHWHLQLLYKYNRPLMKRQPPCVIENVRMCSYETLFCISVTGICRLPAALHNVMRSELTGAGMPLEKGRGRICTCAVALSVRMSSCTYSADIQQNAKHICDFRDLNTICSMIMTS
jgi:hypothetical protein